MMSNEEEKKKTTFGFRPDKDVIEMLKRAELKTRAGSPASPSVFGFFSHCFALVFRQFHDFQHQFAPT